MWKVTVSVEALRGFLSAIYIELALYLTVFRIIHANVLSHVYSMAQGHSRSKVMVSFL